MALTGREILYVIPILWDGTLSPITQQTTVAEVATAAILIPEVLLAALNAAVPFLPTSLPAPSGVIWNNGGVLCVS